MEAWRTVFYAQHTATATSTKRKAFDRARADLVGRRLVVKQEEYYTPSGHPL